MTAPRHALFAILVTTLIASGPLGAGAHAGDTPRPEASASTPARPALDAGEFNSVWLASSGVLPDSSCPAWLAGVSDSLPKFTGGTLRIHTTAFGQNVHYRQLDSVLTIPDTLVVEARLRWESGTDFVGPCGHYRQAAGIAITTSGSTGTLFFVGNGEIFITTAECGPISKITVPTADAAHTYRIVVVGASVRVYRDGSLALSGSTYTSLSDHGVGARVLWGEGTSLAYGTSYWEYLKHNAHAVGCPTTDVASDAALDARGAFAVRAWPNPARGEARVEWTLAKAARVRVAIFDLSGRRLRVLREGALEAGTHSATWDARDEQGRRLSPGAYFCRIETPDGAGLARVVLGR